MNDTASNHCQFTRRKARETRWVCKAERQDPHLGQPACRRPLRAHLLVAPKMEAASPYFAGPGPARNCRNSARAGQVKATRARSPAGTVRLANPCPRLFRRPQLRLLAGRRRAARRPDGYLKTIAGKRQAGKRARQQRGWRRQLPPARRPLSLLKERRASPRGEGPPRLDACAQILRAQVSTANSAP